MPAENRVSASLSAADKTAIQTAIDTIRQKLPFLVSLTAQERRNLVKLGDGTNAFDEKCFNYMTAHPELVPAFINMPELTKDRALLADLSGVWRSLNELSQAVDDTLLLAGHEALLAELPFYNNVRYAASQGVASAKVIYSDLKTRFPGRPSVKMAKTKTA